MDKKSSTLLTAREIHGPYTQLLTNLQGEHGAQWLVALKKLNKRINPWDDPLFSHDYFTVGLSGSDFTYQDKAALEGKRWLNLDTSFIDRIYPLINSYKEFGMWDQTHHAEVVLGSSKLLIDGTIAVLMFTELRQGFGFRVDDFWHIFVELCLTQSFDSFPTLFCIETGSDYEPQTPTLVVVSPDGPRTWKLSVLPHQSVYTYKFPKGTRVVTNSYW